MDRPRPLMLPEGRIEDASRKRPEMEGGLGEATRPSWGAMINDARIELSRGVWWQMAAATAAIFFISLALNIFGDALRDSLDPKLRIQ